MAARDPRRPLERARIARRLAHPRRARRPAYNNSPLPPSEALRTLKAARIGPISTQVVEEIADLTVYDDAKGH